MLNGARGSEGRADAPEWLTTLAAALGTAGFKPLDERRDPGSFGNYLITFARGDVRVRAVKDRGEWRIDLWDARSPREDGQQRTTSGSWLRAVDADVADEADVEQLPVEAEAAWIVERIDQVSALTLDARTWDRLAPMLRQRTLRLFGRHFDGD